MTIADQLRAARKRRGDTQEDAARAIGCSWNTVARWETGSRRPTGLYAREVQRYIKGG